VGPRRAGRVRAVLLIVAAVLVVAMVVVMVVATLDDDGRPSATPPTTALPAGGTVRMGVVGAAFSADPATALVTDPSSAMLTDLLWGRLTATDATTAAPVPALAESWEASADQTTFTFHLRPDATFSDGTPLTSSDVAASLTRLAALGGASLAGERLSTVQGYAGAAGGSLTGVTAPDPLTLVVQLTEPVADLPALLAAPAFGVVPAAVATGARPALPGPTSGPYAVETQDASTMTLRRSPGTSSAAAPPDGFEVHRYDTEAAAAAAYDGGGLDLVPFMADTVNTLVAPGIGVVRLSPAASLWWIAADTTDPVTASVDLRKGMAHAADRSAIVTADLPGRRLLDGLFPPQLPGGVEDPCASLCTVDPAATTAAVAATSPGGAPAVRVDTPDTAGPAAAGAAFASSLTAAGLPTEVRTRPFAEYREQVLAPDRQLFWFGWVGIAATPEAYLPPMFLSGSPDDVTGLASPEVDAAIRTARATADPSERAARWADAEKLVLQLMPVVPLAQAQNAVALSSSVQGFVQRLDGTFAVDRLWLSTP
jgi:peptide/nickel transport system substrate-binding protein